MSDPIRHLSILQSPVFLINSRLGLFTAADLRQRPFSRSYGAILPNSLTMTHSSALGYSPRPPVSVYGTGCTSRYFLEQFSEDYHATRRICVLSLLYAGSTCYSVSTHLLQSFVTFIECRYGNINPFAIHYPVWVRVRTRLTLS